MDENGLVEIPLYSGLRRCLDHFDIPGDSSSVCIMCSSRVVTLTRYLAFKSIKTTADSLEGPRRYKQCRPTTLPLSAVRLLNQCAQELLKPGPEQPLSPYPNQSTKSKSRFGAAVLIARNPTLQAPTLQSLMSPRHQILLIVTCRPELKVKQSSILTPPRNFPNTQEGVALPNSKLSAGIWEATRLMMVMSPMMRTLFK